MPLSPRLILFHKQSTSGRMRFLRLPGGLLGLEPLPALASLVAEDDPLSPVRHHPAQAVQAAESLLGLDKGSLQPEPEFYAEVEVPEGRIPVMMASFTTIDPPFDAAERLGGKFIALTEARGLHPIELDLARRVYEVILG